MAAVKDESDERTFLCERLSVSTGLWEECKLADIKTGDVFRVFCSVSIGGDMMFLAGEVVDKVRNLADHMSAEDVAACNHFGSGEPLMAREDAFPQFGGHAIHVTIISLKTDYFGTRAFSIRDQNWGRAGLKEMEG